MERYDTYFAVLLKPQTNYKINIKASNKTVT